MINKPAVIRYGALGDDLYAFQHGKAIKHLCLRFDARSREKLVEIMARGIAAHGDSSPSGDAEAALSALVKLAEGE